MFQPWSRQYYGSSFGNIMVPLTIALFAVSSPDVCSSLQLGTRLYKTGDRARYLPDGAIEFLSRMDHQVKIRGFRIELGEIETLLCQHFAVQEAVVISQEYVPGDKRLVAYIVPLQRQTPTSSELSHLLKEKLPEYMVPSVFVLLETLPLTPNGKINRRALPEPKGLLLPLAETYVAPQTQGEQTISIIWQEVLNLEKVGIQDNFFDLGGHSLLMAQVHSKLQQVFDRNIPMIAMFKHPTICSLAKYLSQEQSELSSWQKSQDRAQTRKLMRQQRQKTLNT